MVFRSWWKAINPLISYSVHVPVLAEFGSCCIFNRIHMYRHHHLNILPFCLLIKMWPSAHQCFMLLFLKMFSFSKRCLLLLSFITIYEQRQTIKSHRLLYFQYKWCFQVLCSVLDEFILQMLVSCACVGALNSRHVLNHRPVIFFVLGDHDTFVVCVSK